MGSLDQILLLLGVAVAIVVAFNRLRIPSSLGYLLVGLLLGPNTIGPVLDMPQLEALAEFGIVFLLFTIGLNFSLPQIYALRHQVLGLGTGQVVLTTLGVGVLAWLAGLPPTEAFVVGAVFAQSSTTIIAKQLADQGEENSRHGRLGVAMSVFQDVTAVPFIVIIPVLGAGAAADVVSIALAVAIGKALLALAVVIVAGRWILPPLFHAIATTRSAELFTLTVLLVALVAAWTTSALGLSLAFGAFLAGMMLGETEFRHQVEATIRPFRDVLLGLFFIGVGTLLEPAVLPDIWHWALLGTAILMGSKVLIVGLLVRRTGIDALTAWRTGILVSVGGEFGLALLSIAIGREVLGLQLGQIVLTTVLFAMIAGAFAVRFNRNIASWFTRSTIVREEDPPKPGPDTSSGLFNHVIICGYGRIGQSVGNLLDEERIPFVALDLDPVRVRSAHLAGEPVYYGDASDGALLDNLGLSSARLVVISHNDVSAALKALAKIRLARPSLPVMVRTADEGPVAELEAAGAMAVIPETLEAGLMLSSQALLLLDVSPSRVMRRIQEQRTQRYRLMRELFTGDELSSDLGGNRLRSVAIPAGAAVVGQPVGTLELGDVQLSALVRAGHRFVPQPAEPIGEDDVVVLFGTEQDLLQAEKRLVR